MNYEIKCKFLKFTITDELITQNIPKIKIKPSDITKITYKEGNKLVNGQINISTAKIPMTISFSYKDNELAKKIYEEIRVVSNVDSRPPTELELFEKEIIKIPNSTHLGTHNVIYKLPSFLQGNEEIKSYTKCEFEDDNWLLVCTNKRVILLTGGLIPPIKNKTIPLESIISIDQNTGFINSSLSINYGVTKICLSDITASHAKYFIQQVNTYKDLLRRPITTQIRQAANTEKISSNISAADEILKYKNLLDMGAITEEEFNAKKKELLGL